MPFSFSAIPHISLRAIARGFKSLPLHLVGANLVTEQTLYRLLRLLYKAECTHTVVSDLVFAGRSVSGFFIFKNIALAVLSNALQAAYHLRRVFCFIVKRIMRSFRCVLPPNQTYFVWL